MISAGTAIKNNTYGYDPVSNITSITDGLAPQKSQAFTYDNVYRLKTADQTLGYGSHSYDYDAVGNRTNLTENTAATTYVMANTSNRLNTQQDPAIGNFDVSNDFCAMYNPSKPPCNNSAWSYGWSLQPGSEFNLNPYKLIRDGFDVWGEVNYANDPNASIIHNGTNAPLVLAGSLTFAPNATVIHPGRVGENQVVRWTAPRSGQYTVNAIFTRADIGFTDAHVIVTQSNTSLLSEDLNASNTTATLTTNITFNKGETLDFTIGFANSIYAYNSVILNVQVTPTQTNAMDWVYGYDANGNITTKTQPNGDGWYYTYSPRNRLIKTEQKENGTLTTKATYAYNGKGERISKTAGTSTTYYTYGLSGELLQEENGSNQTDYLYANGKLLAINQKTQTSNNLFYVHNDQLGTPMLATNTIGKIVWSATHTPFGETVVRDDVDGDGNHVMLNVRFAGQYFDEETGLHQNGTRDYDPSTGRYLQPDSIGLDGGLNTYAYVGGNPVNWIDPFGLAITYCYYIIDKNTGQLKMVCKAAETKPDFPDDAQKCSISTIPCDCPAEAAEKRKKKEKEEADAAAQDAANRGKNGPTIPSTTSPAPTKNPDVCNVPGNNGEPGECDNGHRT